MITPTYRLRRRCRRHGRRDRCHHVRVNRLLVFGLVCRTNPCVDRHLQAHISCLAKECSPQRVLSPTSAMRGCPRTDTFRAETPDLSCRVALIACRTTPFNQRVIMSVLAFTIMSGRHHVFSTQPTVVIISVLNEVRRKYLRYRLSRAPEIDDCHL